MGRMQQSLMAGVFGFGVWGQALPATALPLGEAQKLLAGDGSAEDSFGHSVAIAGDTAVIGAYGGDDNGNQSGSAYIFTRGPGGNWTEQAKLLPRDGAAEDYFGNSVALAGDTAVIAAPYDDDNGTFSGSAYVFTRDGADNWTEQAKLLPGDGAGSEYFGISVALAGDTVVIGAPYDDENGTFSGSAYVFTRDGSGNWSEQAKLLPGDGAAYDNFGVSVALTGDTVAIGAHRDDNETGNNSGSVYIFTRDNSGTWTERSKLQAGDGADGEYFGASVTLAGDTAVIGVPFDDENGTYSGSAYVFTRDETGDWTEQAKLLPGDGAVYDYFGISVALTADMAVIGAYTDDDNGTDSGSAYVFTRDGSGTWTEQSKLLAADSAAHDHFGISVALAGETAVIGASGDDYKGSAYVFSVVLTPVQQLNYITDQVQALVDSGEAPDGLLAPLTAAEGSLARGNDGAAIGQLEAFIRQVEGMIRSNRLTEAEGNELIALTNQLIQTIEQG